MKNVKLKNRNGLARMAGTFLIFNFAFLISLRADEDFGDITVNASAIYTGNTHHGYAEVRVSLQNRSHGKTHVVTLVSPNRSWSNGNSIGRLARTVTLAPEASEVVSLLQPPLALNGDNQMRVEVDGRDEGSLNTPNANNHCNYSYSSSSGEPVVFVSRSLDFDSVARVFNNTNRLGGLHMHGGSPADAVEPLRAETATSDWSDNWLAYTPFEAIVLNAADLRALPPAVFSAVSDYLFAGGNVILSGETDLPATWQASQKKSLPTGSEYEIGFGKCFIFSSEKFDLLPVTSVEALRDTVRDSAHYWQSLPGDVGAANSLFPVVNNLKIPTRGIVVIMLAFVILIGPVNIIWLSRRKRRTWMLWTIPAISFATTLLVFAYSLLREGITPDTRIAGLTMLDQINHRAATFGAEAFYCPLTPSGGLNFDFETEATPLVRSGYGSGNSREVDWTQSQHFQRGWVSARVPAHFHLRKSETRRERVQIENENGQLQIVNGLGVPIKSLWLANAHGKIFQASNVAAGQKMALTDSTNLKISEQRGINGLNRDFGFSLQNIENLNASADKYLAAGTYIAELDGNPFLENALGSSSSPKRTKSSSVVFGILDSTDAP